MFGQQQRLPEHEHQRQRQTTEQLEVHPEVGGEVVGDHDVEHAHQREKNHPRPVDAVPDRIGELHLLAHEGAHQVLALKHLRPGEDKGKQPVQHGGFPLDEGVVVEQQGRAAEDDDHGQTHPQHRLDLTVLEPDPANLRKGRGDGHRRGGVNARHLEYDEKQDDGEEIKNQFRHMKNKK